MANFAPAHSAQHLDYQASPRKMVKSSDWGSKLRTSFGTLTFTTAGTGTAKMVRLPAGKVRVLVDLCRLVCPAGTVTADLHVGYAAHTKDGGTAVAADDNAFADNLDVGGGALDQTLPLPAVGYLDLESDDGIDIEVMIDTADSPAAGEMILSVVFQMGN